MWRWTRRLCNLRWRSPWVCRFGCTIIWIGSGRYHRRLRTLWSNAQSCRPARRGAWNRVPVPCRIPHLRPTVLTCRWLRNPFHRLWRCRNCWFRCIPRGDRGVPRVPHPRGIVVRVVAGHRRCVWRRGTVDRPKIVDRERRLNPLSGTAETNRDRWCGCRSSCGNIHGR